MTFLNERISKSVRTRNSTFGCPFVPSKVFFLGVNLLDSFIATYHFYLETILDTILEQKFLHFL